MIWIVKIKFSISLRVLTINFYYSLPINKGGIKIDVLAV
ncbi:hypothetical protein CSC04_3107 [Enterobacter roggenkampii]|nr:hypothetical protein CSC04_3107 [Enterobacter roggenkampii]